MPTQVPRGQQVQVALVGLTSSRLAFLVLLFAGEASAKKQAVVMAVESLGKTGMVVVHSFFLSVARQVAEAKL